MTENEVWATIKDYPKYQVSNKGRIKSYMGKEPIIMRTAITKEGYERVGLSNNGKRNTFSVHRLVAQAFIPNPENKPSVNHIDCNKKNNEVSNLEWVNASENAIHAYKNDLIDKTTMRALGKEKITKYNKSRRRPVLQLDLTTGEIIKEWESADDVERSLKFYHSDITRCCKGTKKTCGGFRWKYKFPNGDEKEFQDAPIGKSVELIDVETNLVIKEFQMVKEAAEYAKVTSVTMIEWIKKNKIIDNKKYVYKYIS